MDARGGALSEKEVEGFSVIDKITAVLVSTGLNITEPSVYSAVGGFSSPRSSDVDGSLLRISMRSQMFSFKEHKDLERLRVQGKRVLKALKMELQFKMTLLLETAMGIVATKKAT